MKTSQSTLITVPAYAVDGVPDVFCLIGQFGGKSKEVCGPLKRICIMSTLIFCLAARMQ